jgi:putative holliday junction resolvase
MLDMHKSIKTNNSMKTQRILAFDFGMQNIGVAIGNTLSQSPQELPCLHAKFGKPKWNQILELIKEWDINLIVIGLPLHIDGSENESCVRARKFANRLSAQCRTPIELVDERLSSQEAYELQTANTNIHSLSAMLILQTWFNSQ